MTFAMKHKNMKIIQVKTHKNTLKGIEQ